MSERLEPAVERAPSAHESAVRVLRGRILGGDLAAGARLPPERRLAAELGISRLTLRAVLATLASEGLVRAHPGSGVEVLDFRESGALDLFTWLLAQTDAPPERIAALFAEVVRLRRSLAVDALVSAARNARASDLAALEALAREQRGRVGEPRAYLAGDGRYQRRLIRVAGSTALELLFNSLERVLRRVPDLALAFLGPLDEHLASYELVHHVLRAGDPGEVRRLAEELFAAIEPAGLARVRERCRARAAGARGELP